LLSQIENLNISQQKQRRPDANDVGKRVGLQKPGSLTETTREGVVDSYADGMIIATFDTGETTLPMSVTNFLLLEE